MDVKQAADHRKSLGAIEARFRVLDLMRTGQDCRSAQIAQPAGIRYPRHQPDGMVAQGVIDGFSVDQGAEEHVAGKLGRNRRQGIDQPQRGARGFRHACKRRVVQHRQRVFAVAPEDGLGQLHRRFAAIPFLFGTRGERADPAVMPWYRLHFTATLTCQF